MRLCACDTIIQVGACKRNENNLLSMLILILVFMTDIWIHGILKPHKCFADGFTCTNHWLQHRDGYSADNSSHRTLNADMSNVEKVSEAEKPHLIAGSLIHFHRYRKNSLRRGIEIPL